eukprot:2424368-Heterocapsa_arctica.AAC.1
MDQSNRPTMEAGAQEAEQGKQPGSPKEGQEEEAGIPQGGQQPASEPSPGREGKNEKQGEEVDRKRISERKPAGDDSKEARPKRQPREESDSTQEE